MDDMSFDFTKDVFTCGKEESIEDVISHMQNKKIGSVIIVDGKRPIGIFTERDFLVKIGFNQGAFSGRPISEFMTSNPKTCTKNSSLFDVLHIMNKGRFRHIVVTNELGELEGVASIKDLFDSLLSMFKNNEVDDDFMQQFISLIPDEVMM
jgi:CBS domain-containing protein